MTHRPPATALPARRRHGWCVFADLTHPTLLDPRGGQSTVTHRGKSLLLPGPLLLEEQGAGLITIKAQPDGTSIQGRRDASGRPPLDARAPNRPSPVVLGPMETARPAGRILVIEDDPDARANLRDILEMDDYAVETAGSMGEALTLSSLAEIEVIVLDRRLPDGNALDFLPELARASTRLRP